MATITQTQLSMVDSGDGVVIEATVHVMVSDLTTVVHKLTQSDIALTQEQLAALQGAIDAITTKVELLTAQQFVIP